VIAGLGPYPEVKDSGAGLGPYPEVKDSGIPWLGCVPAHWSLRRGKSLFQSVDIRSRAGAEDLLTVSSKHGVVLRSSASVTMFQAESYVGHKLCWPGDLVINSLWAWGGGLGVAPMHGIVSTAYGVYRLRPEFAGYVAYFHELVRSQPFQWELQVRSKGIWISRLQLTDEAFLAAPFPVPPREDCKAIVRFLDHADRRIRRAIRAKQKLIALLNEQKQAVIHRAVTRGLDPNARLKPSGVDWLGDVPAHWDVRRLRFVASIATGGRDTVDRVDGGEYPFFVRSQTVEGINTYSFDGEAVLTAGDGAGVAKVFHYVNGKFDYHQRVYKLSDFRQVKGSFFFYYFSSSLKFEALRGTAKSTVDSLRLPMLSNFPVVVPPAEEQSAIVLWIEREADGLNRSIKLAGSEIKLLHEYRTRLIADVVTGKLDVRVAATRLPDEVDEPELEEPDVEENDESEVDEREAVEA